MAEAEGGEDVSWVIGDSDHVCGEGEHAVRRAAGGGGRGAARLAGGALGGFAERGVEDPVEGERPVRFSGEGPVCIGQRPAAHGFGGCPDEAAIEAGSLGDGVVALVRLESVRAEGSPGRGSPLGGRGRVSGLGG